MAAFVLSSCARTSNTASTAPYTTNTRAPSPAPTSASSTTPPTSNSPSAPAGRRIDISVKGKQVIPAPATVNIGVGESLTIALTSDKDNTLHAHGFEISQDLKAGQPGTVTITGVKTGVYEFELHDPELRLFQLAVR